MAMQAMTVGADGNPPATMGIDRIDSALVRGCRGERAPRKAEQKNVAQVRQQAAQRYSHDTCRLG
jgi:hypothetical protein